MVSPLLLGALAGAAISAGSSGPSEAFTLSAPSLTQAVVTSDVQPGLRVRLGLAPGLLCLCRSSLLGQPLGQLSLPQLMVSL